MKTYPRNAAFTLVEVLVAATVVVVLMGILLGMTDQTQRLMKSTSSKVEQFQEARVAFESMTRRISQATLNTFWEYDNPVRPTRYQRSAELRFVSGVTANLIRGGADNRIRPGHSIFFHAPNGLVEDQRRFGNLDSALNVWGYFLEIGTDQDTIPPFLRGEIPEKRRFRLMEAMQPTERLQTYEFQEPGSTRWFETLVTGINRPVRVLANNVVALVILPRLSRADEELWKLQNGSRQPVLADRYNYTSNPQGMRGNPNANDPVLNTKNQLPPVVQVVMVAIDEPSARSLEDRFGSDPFLGIDYSNGFFRDPTRLEDNPGTPKVGDGDMSNLEQLLISKRVSYRVFSTNVSIRGAKWSRNQTE